MTKDSLNIALFDSGIGGLSIARELLQTAPYVDIYYFLDREYAPYGNLSQGDIAKRCEEVASYLTQDKKQTLVLACNTATAASIDYLRTQSLIPVVGVEPYLNIIHKEEKNFSPDDKIALLVTQATSGSERFQKLQAKTDPKKRIKIFPSENLARLIDEAFYQDRPMNDILKEVLAEGRSFALHHFDHLILGCTHYEFASRLLEQEFKLKCYHPSQQIVQRILEVVGDSHKNLDRKRSGNLFYQTHFGESWRPMPKEKIHWSLGNGVL